MILPWVRLGLSVYKVVLWLEIKLNMVWHKHGCISERGLSIKIWSGFYPQMCVYFFPTDVWALAWEGWLICLFFFLCMFNVQCWRDALDVSIQKPTIKLLLFWLIDSFLFCLCAVWGCVAYIAPLFLLRKVMQQTFLVHGHAMHNAQCQPISWLFNLIPYLVSFFVTIG